MFICYYSLVWAFLPFFLPYLAFFVCYPNFKKIKRQKRQESKKTKKAKLEKKGNYPAFFEENIVCEANYFVFCPSLIFFF